MEKSKCTAKVAALLMALVIIFIPFGSAFAAGRSYARNLHVDDGFEYQNGTPSIKYYEDHMGTYYVSEGYRYAFLEGEIVNVSSSFNLTVEVRDNDAGRTIRKVTERIKVPSGRNSMYLCEFCSLGTALGGESRFCSRELTKALDLSTLPVGNYSFAFFVDSTCSGTITYVRVYSLEAEILVRQALSSFKLIKSSRDYSDYDVTIYKLSTHQMSGTDCLWNLYVKNQAKGIFSSASKKDLIRTVCRVAFGRYPNAAEEATLMRYCSVMGEPLTIKRIIFSGQCQRHLMDMDINP